MADLVFNNAKGSIVQKLRDGEDLIVVLLKVVETDTTLLDYDDLASLLAGANTEADFTNYTRTVIANANTTVTIDDSNERAVAKIDVPVDFDPAGGATNNSLVKCIVSAEGANDAARVPLTFHDLSTTTDGTQLTFTFNATNGFFRAT